MFSFRKYPFSNFIRVFFFCKYPFSNFIRMLFSRKYPFSNFIRDPQKETAFKIKEDRTKFYYTI